MVTEKTAAVFDQFVYATGADPKGTFGPAAILEPTLLEQLLPQYDKTGRFTKDEGTLVAFATKKRNLWVVGASVFRALGWANVTALQSKYVNVPQMFSGAVLHPKVWP